jgi:hypothetical protein
MKRLVIVAEMPDNAAAALAYGPGRLDTWAEEAFGVMLECDCQDSDTTWSKDVERLYGLRWEDARSVFNVTTARIEDAPGPDMEAVSVELDEEAVAMLEALARDAGMTPKAYLNGPVKDALLGEARKAAGVALA